MRLLTENGYDIPYDECVVYMETAGSRDITVNATIRGRNFILGRYRTMEEVRNMRNKMEKAYCDGKKYFDIAKEEAR